jgi:cell division septation protein DedD/nucleoid DNA-binding protein
MKKTELVKIISKKAAVSESLAKELFDLFLRKIATELQPGESAQFSNVGYFHVKKGKIKIESKDADGENIEYLNLIIFSSSLQFNAKSPDNLMFSVPELKDAEQDNLDGHFSLSADKPVLPDLISKSSFTSDLHEVDVDEILKRKVESLMVNLKKEEKSQADSEFFLVDMNTIDEDQFELEVNEESKRKNSEKKPDSTIHSSETLKSRASDFGKDLTKHIAEESISEVDKEITGTEDKDEITGWDFGKRFWSLSSPSGDSGTKELDKTEPKETADKEKVFNDRKLSDRIEPAEIKNNKTEIENLEIEMDDFKVSEKEEKIGKFERVRSITSSLSDDTSSEEVKGFEEFLDDNINIEEEEIDYDDEFKKITSKVEQFRSEERKKSVEETVVIEKKKGKVQKDIKLNRAEAVRKHRRDSRKSSATKFLTIASVFIIVTGIIYLFLKESSTTENVEETIPPIERIDKATYIERTYDIPVTYPYLKPETEMKVIGFVSTSSKDGKPEKIIEDKVPPKKNIETKPLVKKEIVVEKPTVSFPVKKPSGTAVQSAYNIYKYDDIYIVQVAAFRKKNSAEKEAEKHIAKGYNAFLEEAIIDGVTWHRVRVGNFDTLEKAKQFRKSNN